jgi:hypothetical protein
MQDSRVFVFNQDFFNEELLLTKVPSGQVEVITTTFYVCHHDLAKRYGQFVSHNKNEYVPFVIVKIPSVFPVL